MEIATIEKELKETALTLKGQALAVKVSDTTTYEAAGDLGKAMKDLRQKVVDYFKPLKDAAFKAHKAVTAKESEELKPIDEALEIVRSARDTYAREEERKRREAEAKLQREAEERAEKERQALLKKAEKAEVKGNTEKAAILQEAAENVYVPPVTVAKTVTSTVKELQITVTDPKAFIAELVKRNMQPTMIQIQVAPLKAWVKANGIQSFPGLAIKETVSSRF